MAKEPDELPVSLEGLATSIIEMDLGKYLKEKDVRALVVGAVAKELGVRPVLVRVCYSLLLVPFAELAQGALKDHAQKWALTTAKTIGLLDPTKAGRLLKPLARAIRQVEITRGQKAALQAALLREGFAGAADVDIEALEREADLRERAAAAGFREQVQDFQDDVRESALRILGHLERQPDLLAETAPDQDGVHIYARANQPWVGRDLDMDALRTFRVDPRPFAWWAVIGDGGIGKSRLAFEFSRRLYADGWRAGFLPRDDGFDGWSTWTVLFPTLIVIDDASSRVADIGTIIEALARHVALSDFPVRLLLIDRHDGFLKELREDSLRRETYIKPTQFASRLALKPLAEDATLELALELLGAESASRVDTVLTALDNIDPHARRPLFLRFIAEAVRRGHDPVDWDRADLLRQELDDVRVRRWPKAEGGVTEVMLEEDRRMLAFATFTHSLFFKDLASAAALGAPLPTSTSDNQVARLARMVDAPSLSSWLPPLEPDILGELFVIDLLSRLRNHTSDHADKFLDAAWVLRPVSTWASLRRCFEDWREHSDPVALLEHIPPTGSRSHWASLVLHQLEDRQAENPAEAYTLFELLKAAYATEQSLDVQVSLLRAANELFTAEAGNDLDSALQILGDALRLPAPDETLPSQHASLLSQLGFKSDAGNPYRTLLLSAHGVCRKFGYAASPTEAILQTIDDALAGIPAEHPARAVAEREAGHIRVLWDGKKVECEARKAIKQLQFAQMIASLPQLSMLMAEPRSSELEATLNDTLSNLVKLAAKPRPDFIEDDTWKTWRFELVQLMKSAVAAGRAAQLRPLAAAFFGRSDEMFTGSFVEQLTPDNMGLRDTFLAIATATAPRSSACET